MRDWLSSVANIIVEVWQNQRNTAFLFLPHDDRSCISDCCTLQEVFDQLPQDIKTQCRYVETVYNAAEIKFICKQCDAAIAARMHLSIAALSQGIPVFGVFYQGKFAGLWQLYSLPETETLLDPWDLLEKPELAVQRISAFIRKLPEYKKEILRQLPDVIGLAQKNWQ